MLMCNNHKQEHFINVNKMVKIHTIFKVQKNHTLHIFVEIPIEILAESNNHFIIEVKNGYAKIGLENIFRDIIGFDNLGNPIVGTPRVIPILPEITGPSRPIELKVGTSLDSREIRWKIFADTAPCKTGSIKLCDIEKMKKTNN